MKAIRWRVGLVAGVVLILSACTTAEPAGRGGSVPRTVDLTMTADLAFEPARIEVERGETIVFRVRNASNLGHEAYVGTDEEQRLHATVHAALPADQQAGTTHMGYGIHIRPFGAGELAYTFDSDGEFVIGCHYPGHYESGMLTVVSVSG